MNIRLAAGGAVGQPLFSSSASQLHPLGAKAEARDGRRFRYVKVGSGSALVVGNMIQSRAQDVDQDTHSVATAAAIGDTSITITVNTSGDVLANEFASGWVMVDTTEGLGYQYKIKSHPAAAAAATLVLTLDKDTPIQVALTTANSKVTIVYNPYDSVIQSPATTLTGTPIGSAVYPIAASEFGWIQSGGVACVLTKGTPAVGCPVSVPGSAGGAVVIDAGNGTTYIVGRMVMTGVDGKALPVYLDLD